MSADARPSCRPPSKIAASIDTDTTEGHNLRALLLRLRDGDDWQGDARRPVRHVIGDGLDRGLLDIARVTSLTPLGREVAELLRQRIGMHAHGVRCLAGSLCYAMTEAERIAALLTRDDIGSICRACFDIDKAKQYRTEST
jgi:hypothetical protein